MSETPEPKKERINKAEPVTPAEEYLSRLCQGTFLSLWSYPGIFRDQGRKDQSGDGKEVCDHLVVFGNDIIIFSDKHCQFPDKDLSVSWKRWFRRAIESSAHQAWGAERWIRQYPDRLFIDRLCTTRFPIALPSNDKATFHLVVVAHGVSDIVRKTFGASGSLMINAALQGSESHEIPFQIGDLDPKRTFVHVLDDESVDLLLRQRDTITDFVDYLKKRAAFLRRSPVIFAPGEEELLALYLRGFRDDSEHDFVLPPMESDFAMVQVPEGLWDELQARPERIAQLKEDRISYLWDNIIEKCNEHVLEDTQYSRPAGGFKDSEIVIRFMAKEPRYIRRYLSRTLIDMVETTAVDQRRLRIWKPVYQGQPYYVLLVFPFPPGMSEETVRLVRQKFMQAACMVTKLMNPDAKDIVGFATECGKDREDRSEDYCYLDASEWDEELQAEAAKLQAEFQIMVKPTWISGVVREFPSGTEGKGGTKAV